MKSRNIMKKHIKQDNDFFDKEIKRLENEIKNEV
jgi:hypothetical protein